MVNQSERLIFMAFDGVFMHYLVAELKQELLHGRINKIYQISSYELILNIRSNNRNHKLLLSIHPVYARLHLTQHDFDYPAEPPMFTMLLRKHLEGGIIENIAQKDNDRIVMIDILFINEIGDRDQKQLIIEIMGKHSNIILLNKTTGKIIDCIKHISPFQNTVRTLQPGSEYRFPPTSDKKNFFTATMDDFTYIASKMELVSYFEGVSPLLAGELLSRAQTTTPLGLYHSYLAILDVLKHLQPTMIEADAKAYFYLFPLKSIQGTEKYFNSLSDLLDRYYFNKDAQERIRQQSADLEKYIKHELEKNQNKLNALHFDLEEAKQAEVYKLYGELIIANAYQIEKGMRSISVSNYYNGSTVEIPLDPLLGPIENSQKYYAKYNKAKKAIVHIQEQIHLTEAEIRYFDLLAQQIETASLQDALEIRQELESLGYLKKRSKSRQRKNQKPQYETYYVDGAVIYVGKNNLQNDYLTFQLAQKDDLWLHAKDMPGSHVIIRTDGEITENILRTGAQLASYYSKGRYSSSVAVDYTIVKNVKKIPGAKPGFVTYTGQKTIYIDPDEDLIHQLTLKKS